MAWVVFNETKGYMYEDEDLLPGARTYDHIIDEFTITFDNEDDAKFNCGSGDIAVKV